jgi:hypothetical protein
LAPKSQNKSNDEDMDMDIDMDCLEKNGDFVALRFAL